MTREPADERPSQRTLVIIPTYNERENLPLIVGRVHEARPDVHVLVVDDGSPDGTGQLADELALADPDRSMSCTAPARTVSAPPIWPVSPGAWAAGTRCWWRWTPTAAMHPSSCTAARRDRRAAPIWRSARATSRAAASATGRGAGWRCPRPPTGIRGSCSASASTTSPPAYRAYRREVLEKIDLSAVDSKGYCFQIELTWRTINNGFNVVEVPITFTERELGSPR